MRKLLAFILFRNYFPLLAQTARNGWLVGGNAFVRYEPERGPITWTTDVQPKIGYFLGNNVALGVSLPFTFSSQKTSASSGIIGFVDGQQVRISKITSLNIGLAPFIRGYIGSGKFRPFLQAQAGVVSERATITYETAPKRSYRENNLFISGGTGIAYFVSEYVGLEALLDGTYNDGDGRFFPPTSLGLYFGIQFYLPKK